MVHSTLQQDLRVGVAIFIVCVGPFLDLPLMKQMRAERTSLLRLRFYRYGGASLWVIGLTCFALMGWHGLVRLSAVLVDLGVLGKMGWRIGMAVVSGAFFVVGLMPGVVCLFRARSRVAYTRAVAKSEISFMLPLGVRERRWFALISVSAGVWEEVICRGFLMTFARGELHLGLLLALVVTSVAFGFNHLYQGLGGIVKTSVIGLMLGFVAVLSGGLLVPMILHAAIDLQILAMYQPEVGDGGHLGAAESIT